MMKEYKIKVVTSVTVKVKEKSTFDSPEWIEAIALNAAHFGVNMVRDNYEVEIEPTRVVQYDTDSSTEEVPE